MVVMLRDVSAPVGAVNDSRSTGSANGVLLFGQRCHRIAARAARVTIPDLLGEIALLVEAADATQEEARFLMRGLVAHTIGCVAGVAGLHTRADVAAACVALQSVGADDAEWRARVQHVLACVKDAAWQGVAEGPTRPVMTVRIRKALEFIEAHYDDATLTLRRVADHVGFSVCYLARVLKEETGVGFVAHVRRCRVSATYRLMSDTLLTVKEVAFMTGYGTIRQMERDFKRVYGVTPNTLREMAAGLSLATNGKPPRRGESTARLLRQSVLERDRVIPV